MLLLFNMEIIDNFVLGKILNYLDQKTICHLICTCKYFNKIKNILERIEMTETMKLCQLNQYPNLHELILNTHIK